MFNLAEMLVFNFGSAPIADFLTLNTPATHVMEANNIINNKHGAVHIAPVDNS